MTDIDTGDGDIEGPVLINPDEDAFRLLQLPPEAPLELIAECVNLSGQEFVRLLCADAPFLWDNANQALSAIDAFANLDELVERHFKDAVDDALPEQTATLLHIRALVAELIQQNTELPPLKAAREHVEAALRGDLQPQSA